VWNLSEIVILQLRPESDETSEISCKARCSEIPTAFVVRFAAMALLRVAENVSPRAPPRFSANKISPHRLKRAQTLILCTYAISPAVDFQVCIRYVPGLGRCAYSVFNKALSFLPQVKIRHRENVQIEQIIIAT